MSRCYFITVCAKDGRETSRRLLYPGDTTSCLDGHATGSWQEVAMVLLPLRDPVTSAQVVCRLCPLWQWPPVLVFTLRDSQTLHYQNRDRQCYHQRVFPINHYRIATVHPWAATKRHYRVSLATLFDAHNKPTASFSPSQELHFLPFAEWIVAPFQAGYCKLVWWKELPSLSDCWRQEQGRRQYLSVQQCASLCAAYLLRQKRYLGRHKEDNLAVKTSQGEHAKQDPAWKVRLLNGDAGSSAAFPTMWWIGRMPHVIDLPMGFTTSPAIM